MLSQTATSSSVSLVIVWTMARSVPSVTGNIVLCREVYPEDWGYGLINTKYPYVVIVSEEEGILIKRLIKHSRKENTITLHSLNRDYEDVTKSLSDVRAFFYVERIDRSVQVW